MIQCGFVDKRMLWLNQKGFLNYKRYCFLNVFWGGIKAVTTKAVFSAI